MPPAIRIQKQAIIDSAFQITRENGMNSVNVRAIAKRLNCSVQPIYYHFSNMEDLKMELIKYIEEYFYQFLVGNINDSMPEYKQTGINYIKFAKEEPELFKILFMTKTDMPPERFISSDEGNYEKYEKIIKACTNLKDEDLKSFHIKMWIFTHGIATLVASQTCKLNDEQISSLLTSEFKALILAEKQEM